MRRVAVNVLVFGAGVAGLWTARSLRARGQSCVVIEPRGIGGVQSIASQGIIHGGIKYALTGSASRASRAIARMPELWQACLDGTGPIDLRDVTVLSPSQTLFTTGGIGAKLAGVAASKAIRTDVARLRLDERPDGFEGAPKSVDLYRVDEPVLDPLSLMRSLSDPLTVLRTGTAPRRTDAGVSIEVGDTVIEASRALLCAGAGNAGLLRELAIGSAPSMQRRPLHMVFARGPRLPMLWAHAIGTGTKPLATITSQRDDAGRVVWYIGGDLSEQGVSREAPEQIDVSSAALARLVPWADLSAAEWATLRIDRAEPATETGRRPDEPFVEEAAPGIVVTWPTKLAFAPAVSEQVLDLNASDTPLEMPDLSGLERAPMTPLPWNSESVTWS